MNYHEIYEKLIRRGQQRFLPENVYTEKHHIIPKCLGGSDTKSNLVSLTGREHYIAHLLLWKMYPLNIKLFFAFRMMCTANNNGKRDIYKNSRFYERTKTEYKEYLKNLPEETRIKISVALKGRKQSPETIEKRRQSRLKNKKPYSAQTIEKRRQSTLRLISSGWKPNTSGFKSHIKGEFKHTDETKQKLRMMRIGKKYDEIYGEEKTQQIKEKQKLKIGNLNPNYCFLDPEQIRKYIDEGKTVREIKKLLNTSYQTITNRFKEYFGMAISEYTDSKGLTKNGTRIKNTINAHEIMQLIQQGKTIKEIQLIINASPDTIRKKFRDFYNKDLSDFIDLRGRTKTKNKNETCNN